VLVFRDQHVTPHQLLAAMGLFGEVFPQHNSRFALPECPLVHYISNQDFYPDGRRYIPGEGFHTDHSNAVCPPRLPYCMRSACPTGAAIPNTSICTSPMTNCRKQPSAASTG
jgi:alpha-ketoglutarate-dependent taurine dioxygenase